MTRVKWMFAAVAIAVMAAAGVVVTTRDRGEAVQEPPAARGSITPHAYPLDDAHYLRWALPPGEEAYRTDQRRAPQDVGGKITAVSRKSRDDGERFWGRIAGTKYPTR